MFGIDIYIDTDIRKQVASDAEKYVQKLYEGRKRQIIDAYGQLINPWVPYETGQLSHYTVDTANSALKYNAFSNKGYNYADVQYNADDSNWNRNRSVHPLATSRWDEVAAPIIQDEFTEFVKEIMHR